MNTIENFLSIKTRNGMKNFSTSTKGQRESTFLNFLTYENDGKGENDLGVKETLDDPPKIQLTEIEESTDVETPKIYFLPFFEPYLGEDKSSLKVDAKEKVETIKTHSIFNQNDFLSEINYEEAWIHHSKMEKDLIRNLKHSSTNKEEISPKIVNVNPTGEQIKDQSIFANISRQFEKIFAEIDATNLDLRVGKRILHLLNQWSNHSGQKTFVQTEAEAKLPEKKLWDDLLRRFESRIKIHTNTSYSFQARVTAKDVITWLTNGVAELAEIDKTNPKVGPNPVQLGTLPMSKMEQFIIHLQSNNDQLPIEDQLMNRFQDAIKTSRFLHIRNGIEQLTFSIRPENLGEMTVKMARINGEIIVKILVNSHATRQILETNMHQLKNTFSPHQVVVEDLASNIKDSETSNDDRNKEQLYEEQSDDSKEGHSKQDTKDSHEEELNFHDVLIHAKV